MFWLQLCDLDAGCLQVQQRLTQLGGHHLSMALWALATFKRQPTDVFMDAWYAQAWRVLESNGLPVTTQQPLEAAPTLSQASESSSGEATAADTPLIGGFDAASIAYSSWALCRLQLAPSGGLMELLTRRALEELGSFSNMEMSTLVASLADMQYR